MARTIMKNIKNENIYGLVDKIEIYKMSLNRNISDMDTKRFVDSIMENYFLDNDNINFLENNGFHFFKFSDNELCFCLSGKPYVDCCSELLQPKMSKKYVTYIETLLDKKLYKEYIENMWHIYEQEYKEIVALDTCYYPGCKGKTTKTSLYDYYLKKDEYVATQKVNPFDKKYKMGEIFFQDIDVKAFDHQCLCEEHIKLIRETEKKEKHELIDILNISFETIISKLVRTQAYWRACQKEYINFFNSIEEEGMRAYFTVHLKKTTRIFQDILDKFNKFSNIILSKNYSKMHMQIISLPTTSKFVFKDLVYPQIIPDTFDIVNSVNNALLIPKSAVLSVLQTKNYSMCYFLYTSDHKEIKAFFDAFSKKIMNSMKNEAAFVSNCSLVLGDNIIFNKKWFNSLSDDDKKLYSALNKFRYENPNVGQEYIKMKFFSGFDRGNNFF